MKQKKQLHIVFDMANTLTDEFGKGVWPGIPGLLKTIENDGHYLSLWTSSTRNRAVTILSDHNLEQFLQPFVFRENYDPERKNLPEDIRNIDTDILVDDDPKQIDFVNGKGLTEQVVFTSQINIR